MVKEVKIEDINPVAHIKDTIWRSIELLRGIVMTTDYYMVLFLISLIRDGMLDKINSFERDINLNEIFNSISESQLDNIEAYRKISKYFIQLLEKINNPTIFTLVRIYSTFNKEILKENFPDIFDDILYKISAIHGKGIGDFIQPIEISRFICGLAELDENSSVYNPFAGLVSFGVFMEGGQHYYGQEFNERTWALGMLRIMAYQRYGKSTYSLGDSILNWSAKPNSVDLVIANPPYAMKLQRHHRFAHSVARTYEHFLIERGLESINERGKVIVMVSLSVLFANGPEKQLRENLVNNDLLDTIISFPGGLLSHTGIPFAIIVINKAKSEPGIVRFIDAKEFVIHSTNNKEILDDNALNSAINKNQESKSIKLVSTKKIVEYDCNLNVPRYFQKDYKGTRLRDIGRLIKGKRIDENSFGKFVRIRDLADDKIQNRLNISAIEEVKIPSHTRKIEESCILITIRWKSFKPTIFNYTGIPIYISNDIIAFKPDKKKVDFNYLIYQIHSDKVTEQAEYLRIGSTIPYLRSDDLLDIKIEIVELEKQLSQTFDLLTNEDKLKEIEFNNRLNIAIEKYNKELENKQHNIRQHLKNVTDSVMVLMRLMDKNNGVLKIDDVVNEKRNINVGQRFEKLQDSLQNVVSEVDNLTNDIQFDEIEEIDLVKEVKNSIDEKGKLSNYDIEFDIDTDSFKESDINEITVDFSKKAFKELFNNIIENAENHAGFDDNRKHYVIRIELAKEKNNAILKFSNNGLSWPKEIKNSLGTKGIKAGKNANKGIGVWKIIEIIKHYNAHFEIIDDPESEFPVGWEFIFELKNISI